MAREPVRVAGEKRRRSIEDRKEEIFFIITELISEKGLSGVTTGEVARRLGVSQPAIYKYFKNKDEMILYFIGHLKEVLAGVVEKSREGKTLREKFLLLYEKHFELIERTRVLPRIIFSDTIHLGDPSRRDRLRRVLNYYRDYLKELVKEGIASGELEEVDPDVAVNFIQGSILARTMQWMLDGMKGSLVREKNGCIRFLDRTLFRS